MIEPPFAIGLFGLVPEEPTLESLEDVFSRLGPCPACDGTGYVRHSKNVGWTSSFAEQSRCDFCFGQPVLFWCDGLEYYEARAHTATDTLLTQIDQGVRDWWHAGWALRDLWPKGVDNYGFHLWRKVHAFSQ